MAELRMRFFSNRDKEESLEELEEQINEFLRTVYQIERILQSGGDNFTTVTVWYWDRPSVVGQEPDQRVAELESELQSPSPSSPGSAGSGEALSHTHVLAAQGVRSLSRQEGNLEHAGLDTTDDDLRHSSGESHFPFPHKEGAGSRDDDPALVRHFSDSLDDDLEEPAAALPASLLSPAELAWEHAQALYRLEDTMLTVLETLTAFRANHPLAGTELMDSLLNEELLVQMVEQARAASEELGSNFRDYALRNGVPGWNPTETKKADWTRMSRYPRSSFSATTGQLENKSWAMPSEVDPAIQQLRQDLSALEEQLESAGSRKNVLVSRLRSAIAASDPQRQKAVSLSLTRLQQRLADLHKGLRDLRDRLSSGNEPRDPEPGLPVN